MLSGVVTFGTLATNWISQGGQVDETFVSNVFDHCVVMKVKVRQKYATRKMI